MVRQFAAGGLGRFSLATVLGPGLVLISTLVSAAAWGAENFGNFSHALASAQLLGTFITLGTARGLLRLGANSMDGSIAPFRAAAACTAGTGMAVLVLLLFVPKLADVLLPFNDGPSIELALGIWVLSFGLNAVAQAALMAIGREASTGNLLLIRSVTFALLLTFVGVAGTGVSLGIIIVAVFEFILSVALMVWTMLKVFKLARRQQSKTGEIFRSDRKRCGIFDAIKNGLPSLLSEMAVHLSIWLIITLLANTSGPAAVAAFSIAQRLYIAGTMVPLQISFVFVPRLVRSLGNGATDSFAAELRKAALAVVGSGFVMSVAAVMLAVTLAALNVEYSSYLFLLIIVSFCAIIGSVNAFLIAVVQARGWLRNWVALEAGAVATTVVLAVCLISQYGLAGAIWAFVGGHLTRTILAVLVIAANRKTVC